MTAGPLSGRCLCGAVRIALTDYSAEISACHCDMCRRWSGGAMMGFDAPAAALTVTGPVRVYASSAFAERAWCDECGSHLWFRETAEGQEPALYELAPGLFDEAKDMPLTREVYADRAMRGCRFAGDHARVTRAEYEAENPFVNDGDAT